MLPLVSRQFVAAGKPPAAALPVTHVRLLSGVGAQVRLEVGGLRVGLGTAGEGAGVHDHLPPAQPPATSLLERQERRGSSIQGGVEAGSWREALGEAAWQEVHVEVEVLVCGGRGVAVVEVMGLVGRAVVGLW